MDGYDFSPELVRWYADAARPLPWRAPGTSAWAVLVSEVMLQQTPVARVRPAYDAWLARWPNAAALAAQPAGEAVRMWGRLGYPRRALRLHASARLIVAEHGGAVPSEVSSLQRLPGVGAYTARAVAAFAFGQRVPVVDTNVRRVYARLISGRGAAGPAATARDLRDVESLLPADPATATRVSAALMELGALVCTARAPSCERCPFTARCAWQRAGRPVHRGPAAARQPFAGTDRQARGRLLAVVRDGAGPVTGAELEAAWPEPVQRARALASLLEDGLLTAQPGPRYALPG